MKFLTKADLFAATQVPKETVNIPELGGAFIVRGMTGVERDAFEATLFEGKGKHRKTNLANARAKLVTLCVVDEAGHRLFSDSEVAQIGEVRADVISRLSNVAQRLSGLTEEDMDEMGKPSGSPTPSATSSSTSPTN